MTVIRKICIHHSVFYKLLCKWVGLPCSVYHPKVKNKRGLIMAQLFYLINWLRAFSYRSGPSLGQAYFGCFASSVDWFPLFPTLNPVHLVTSGLYCYNRSCLFWGPTFSKLISCLLIFRIWLHFSISLPFSQYMLHWSNTVYSELAF